MTQTRKKVLFIITKSNWGGAQRYVYNLATSLPEEQFEVAVAFGGTGEAGAHSGMLEQKLRGAGIRTMFVPSFMRDVSLTRELGALVELVRLMRRERPDVVHLNSSKAGGVGALAARLAGVKKIIFTSHGLAWDEDRSRNAKKTIKLFSWLTFLLCTHVITITKDNFDRARALPFCNKKIVLVRNGLPALTFESRERARLSLALKAGLLDGGDDVWIGTIAELTPNKALPSLIEAAAILCAQGKRFQLFILGGGEEEEALRDQIAESDLDDCVRLLGFVPDAYRYDRAFDIFTLTSIKEGLPTVLLEAGQAGCAVVASNIPGNAEIVSDSETGLLAAPKDPRDLAANVARLIDDVPERRRLAAALCDKVTRDFSLVRMVDETVHLYRS